MWRLFEPARYAAAAAAADGGDDDSGSPAADDGVAASRRRAAVRRLSLEGPPMHPALASAAATLDDYLDDFQARAAVRVFALCQH